MIQLSNEPTRLLMRGALVVAVVLGAITLPLTAQAKGEKVTICHIPPGNPANAHTITISVSALQTHIDQHGDTVGECGSDDGGGDDGGGDTGGE